MTSQLFLQIVHECIKVLFGKVVDDVLITINCVIDDLYQYYATEPEKICSKPLSETMIKRTDKVDSLIIEQVYKELLSKPLKNKVINPIWTSCEVFFYILSNYFYYPNFS